MDHKQNIKPATLRAKTAAAFLSIGISTLFRWVQEGKLPKPIRLSTRCSVWKISDLEKFLEQQSAKDQPNKMDRGQI